MLLTDQYIDRIKNLLNYYRGEMAWAQVKQAYFADCYRTPLLEMRVGDWVWLDVYNISTQRPIKSLDYKNLCPY